MLFLWCQLWWASQCRPLNETKGWTKTHTSRETLSVKVLVLTGKFATVECVAMISRNFSWYISCLYNWYINEKMKKWWQKFRCVVCFVVAWSHLIGTGAGIQSTRSFFESFVVKQLKICKRTEKLTGQSTCWTEPKNHGKICYVVVLCDSRYFESTSVGNGTLIGY